MAEKERHSLGYGSQRWIVKEEVRTKAGVNLSEVLFTPRKLKRIAPSLISVSASASASASASIGMISSPFSSSTPSFTSSLPTFTSTPRLLSASVPITVCESNPTSTAANISLLSQPTKIRRLEADYVITSSVCVLTAADSTEVQVPLTTNNILPLCPSMAEVKSTSNERATAVDQSTERALSDMSGRRSPVKSRTPVITKPPKHTIASSSNNSSNVSSSNSSDSSSINNSSSSSSKSNKNGSNSNIHANGYNSNVKNSSLFRFFNQAPLAISSPVPLPSLSSSPSSSSSSTSSSSHLEPVVEQNSKEISESDPISILPNLSDTNILNSAVKEVEIITLDNEDSIVLLK